MSKVDELKQEAKKSRESYVYSKIKQAMAEQKTWINILPEYFTDDFKNKLISEGFEVYPTGFPISEIGNTTVAWK